MAAISIVGSGCSGDGADADSSASTEAEGLWHIQLAPGSPAERVMMELADLGVADATTRSRGPESLYLRATMSRAQRQRALEIDGVRQVDRAIRVTGVLSRYHGGFVLATAAGEKYALDFTYSGVPVPRTGDGPLTVEGVPTDGASFYSAPGATTLLVRAASQT